MANFDTGVKRYIKTYAVVEVFFPVDWKDNPEVACKHCPFFVRSSQRCGLTQSVVNYPDKYVGECCPLEEVRDDVC
jgi:hypothetical protein